ncbi:MAG TPA: MBL fold metallo-hydrolase [Sphingopyxis sp.]|nr:MBL fold metallo-hydrolase [Sphingopyxis sp.]
MRSSFALLSIAALAIVPVAAVVAQDAVGVPVSRVGEEIFAGDYLPEPPQEEAVPLEPGQPLAGFAIPGAEAMSNAGLAEALAKRERADRTPAAPNAPLLRNIRRANGLPRFRKSAAIPAAQPLDPAAELKVHFVNVGQGAGAILEFPCHTAIIDTGGEYAKGPDTVDGGKLFADYLARFFAERPNRKNVIDLLITSHPHADHLKGLALIPQGNAAGPYRVRNVVDNGQTHRKGSLEAQKAFRQWAVSQAPPASYSYVNFRSAITATGVTNRVIDPIGYCGGVDPVITALWGAYNEKIRPNSAWENPNNHSVVIRVDFGRSSFLFTGDLEDVGAKEMLREYEDNLAVFDVDVYHVSHHGAGNDTFDALIRAMTPRYAILSMGAPAARVEKTAWAYGHPRAKVIDALQKEPDIVSESRRPKRFPVAPAVKRFTDHPVTRAIYGTGWEDTIVMSARADGTLRIVSGQD